MLFSSSFIHILAPFLPISTIYRRQSFHCSVNLPCNTTPHSRYVYNRSLYCILNWAWATCVLRNEPLIVVALDLVATPRVQKALDRCLSQTTRVKILCLNTKAWNLTCWENDPLQSKPKSAEQTKSSIRKITSPQITVYIFWGFPNGNNLFFRPEFPVFPWKCTPITNNAVQSPSNLPKYENWPSSISQSTVWVIQRSCVWP